MPRGGRRAGAPGASYSNRTDLNATRTLPVTTVPSQQYGQGAQQAAAQKQIPMASGPLPTTPPPTPTAPNGPATTATPSDMPAGPLPGEVTPLDAPSERPGEHVMSGVPTGPGPGPEALPPTAPPDPVLQGLAILNSSQHPLPPEIAAVARYVGLAQAQQVPT